MTRFAARIAAPLALALVAVGGGAGQPGAGLSSLSFHSETILEPQPAGAVNLNGVRLMTIRGRGWASAAAAKQAAEALRSAALDGISEGAIYVKQAEGGYAIIAGERRVVVIDSAVAKAMKSSREALAEQWAARLREAFSRPYLSLQVPLQIVPMGERRTVTVRGRWDQLRVVADTQIVNAGYDPVARVVSLLGTAPGQTQVLLEAGPARIMLPVQVMKYAGQVALTAEAVVTGRVAPTWVIRRAASAAVYYSIAAEPGASAEISGIVPDKPTMGPGESARVSVAVTLAGPGYLPVRANSQVRVVNRAIPPAEASVLMVSNRPERLPSSGLWYEGRIPQGHPARLLYHHVNATGADAELAIELVNPTDRPVRVQIVEASGGPSLDEVFVGHKAARDFLERQRDDVGYVVAMPQGCSYTASATLVKRGQVVSGLAELRVLDAGELRVRVRLRPPSSDLVTPMPASAEGLSTWVFSEPHKRFTASYRVGEHWAFATIGDRQVLSSSGRELLDGDYGVFYDVTFEVENPTDRPAEVELGFMPGGGLARGIVVIDGRIYETGLLRYGETQRVYTFTVGPHARRELRVRTMPQAGSNYPVKLVMRPRGVWD